MAKAADPKLLAILEEYGETPREAMWDCHGTWVIYHRAIERIAARAGISFDMPEIVEAKSADKIVAIVARGFMGDRSEWSFGEAAPGNNKNSYPYAMAEKRAKDRVVLKLVGLHGLAYSEEESYDFRTKEEFADAPAASGQSHLKANGKPEKGWRSNGTRTSYWLKTNGSWESLKSMLDDDLLDCRSLVQLEQIKTIYRDMAREQRWNKEFLDALTHEFNHHERTILNKLDAEELAEIPLKDALNKSLAQHPLNAG
ncbi:MAG: hypothetical protein E5X86_19610 [Mesorhizobium sp.]|uniref:hypothetical protein n=1 Tax=Mesorhizobium sp. TaxID=1871066 RepID=UPI0012151671|nr:hypothetical protein [Mesorhizobium sp.]TIO15580.1 MAG: hypothetical protein E5X86_19610 [Mesorhizobium sp.]